MGTSSMLFASREQPGQHLLTFTDLSTPLERETGIEPASLAWKARVLPLNSSRLKSAGAGAMTTPPTSVQAQHPKPPIQINQPNSRCNRLQPCSSLSSFT